MKIIIVENEPLPLAGLINFVRSCGYSDITGFSNVSAAKEGLCGIEEPFVVLLDHDLGEGVDDGYVLCEWLRVAHPLGHILPIVYLTGRLPPDKYISNQLARPFAGPTVYVAKTDAERQVGELLEVFHRQFDEVRRAIDDQAARRALATLASVNFAEDEEEGK